MGKEMSRGLQQGTDCDWRWMKAGTWYSDWLKVVHQQRPMGVLFAVCVCVWHVNSHLNKRGMKLEVVEARQSKGNTLLGKGQIWKQQNHCRVED